MPLQFSPPITTARGGLVARIAASAGASVASRLALVSLSCGSLLISNHSLASVLAAKRAATCFHTAASQGAVAAGSLSSASKCWRLRMTLRSAASAWSTNDQTRSRKAGAGVGGGVSEAKSVVEGKDVYGLVALGG